jgi:ABC-2 type transport system permease protein
MKQLVFNIKQSFILLRASIVYTFQAETAYAWASMASLLGVILVAITQIIFVNTSFSSIDTIAGYTKDQMMVFTTIGFISFIVSSYLFSGSINELVKDVNKGTLDFALVRPVPSLFYMLTRKISIFNLIKEGLPGFIVLFLAINWTALSISPESILPAIICFFCGQFCSMYIQFSLSLPVFWFGESSQLIDLAYLFDYRLGRFIPYEGINSSIRIFFTSIIPVMIGTGVTTSILFGKSDISIVYYVIAITILLLFVQNWLWKMALRSYTSASS